jgi:hypothetical protein
MTASTFDAAHAQRKATGYRRQSDGTYLEEPQLPHGAFGAMGGLLTTANDLGRYVAFQLSAWPPRDDAERGPVRRSSVREMNHLWNLANLTGGKLPTEVRGYGYGLRVSADCRFSHIVGHGGGLPGFGSYMAWLPEYGVGMFAMANLTYVGPAQPISESWDVLLKTGGLQKRELPASPMLSQARDRIFEAWKSRNPDDLKKIAAMNLLLDIPVSQRTAQMEKLKSEVGECSTAGPVLAENWMRGQFNLTCERGIIGVFFTLAPTNPADVQHLSFQLIDTNTRLGAPTGAPAGVACS